MRSSLNGSEAYPHRRSAELDVGIAMIEPQFLLCQRIVWQPLDQTADERPAAPLAHFKAIVKDTRARLLRVGLMEEGG